MVWVQHHRSWRRKTAQLRRSVFMQVRNQNARRGKLACFSSSCNSQGPSSALPDLTEFHVGLMWSDVQSASALRVLCRVRLGLHVEYKRLSRRPAWSPWQAVGLHMRCCLWGWGQCWIDGSAALGIHTSQLVILLLSWGHRSTTPTRETSGSHQQYSSSRAHSSTVQNRILLPSMLEK